jgi:hypothetical protein
MLGGWVLVRRSEADLAALSLGLVDGISRRGRHEKPGKSSLAWGI